MPRGKGPEFSPDAVEKMRLELSKMPPPKPAALSQREAFNAMRSEIKSALDRGFTLDDVVRWLHGKGFDLGLATVRSYMSAQSTKRRAPGSKNRKTAPKDGTAASSATPSATLSATPAATRRNTRRAADSAAPTSANIGRFIDTKDDDL